MPSERQASLLAPITFNNFYRIFKNCYPQKGQGATKNPQTGVNDGKDFEGVRDSVRQLEGSNMTWKEMDQKDNSWTAKSKSSDQC